MNRERNWNIEQKKNVYGFVHVQRYPDLVTWKGRRYLAINNYLSLNYTFVIISLIKKIIYIYLLVLYSIYVYFILICTLTVLPYLPRMVLLTYHFWFFFITVVYRSYFTFYILIERITFLLLEWSFSIQRSWHSWWWWTIKRCTIIFTSKQRQIHRNPKE